MTPAFTYAVGDLIEARDPASNKWRPATVIRLKPYRGRPGYDIAWQDIDWAAARKSAGPAPSCGGWTYELCMRARF